MILRSSVKRRQGSLKRRSRELSRNSLDWSGLSRRSRDMNESDIRQATNQTITSDMNELSDTNHIYESVPRESIMIDSDDLTMSEMNIYEEPVIDRNSTSSWESDLMATIAIDDLNVLESVLDNNTLHPDDVEEVLPDGNPSMIPDELMSTIQPPDQFPVGLNSKLNGPLEHTQALDVKKKMKRYRCEAKKRDFKFYYGASRKATRVVQEPAGVTFEIPFSNAKQSMVWSRKLKVCLFLIVDFEKGT